MESSLLIPNCLSGGRESHRVVPPTEQSVGATRTQLPLVSSATTSVGQEVSFKTRSNNTFITKTLTLCLQMISLQDKPCLREKRTKVHFSLLVLLLSFFREISYNSYRDCPISITYSRLKCTVFETHVTTNSKWSLS